jgi:hypothetical protein
MSKVWGVVSEVMKSSVAFGFEIERCLKMKITALKTILIFNAVIF